ncbi:putative oxidoreductase DltE [Psilocybe cubensis]|uniref:Oxidoreductase DltE n=2 Tax=Psilocybe cubensis TaxID=181762 RepID=A0ACB8HGZ2_PSICU|nr:putative oxidoreductase DltE [Psilocybe cubensis]KAH9486746.1 putative oxidoreductase DltE [Psilocybe cubensis]
MTYILRVVDHDICPVFGSTSAVLQLFCPDFWNDILLKIWDFCPVSERPKGSIFKIFVRPKERPLGLLSGVLSKAALHSFTTSLRAQLHATNVHVMEIIPPLVESELHDAQGTTPMLSKFWMPLDQFTKETMEGLQRGDAHIAVGTSKSAFEKYEEGKAEAALGIQKTRESQGA